MLEVQIKCIVSVIMAAIKEYSETLSIEYQILTTILMCYITACS